ncbi:MAG: helix-turn-helix domain-containing protein [Candidatus Limnocylindrales bacterium]
MDDQCIGWSLRSIRTRKGWRQEDLAMRAGVSRWVVLRIEQGRLGGVPLGKIRAVAGALDARLDSVVRWQGGDLGRLVSARHARMHELMARFFGDLPGWIAEPEVSFSIYGERGVIDILAWYPTRRILLVVELKTEIVDISEFMATLDRNAPARGGRGSFSGLGSGGDRDVGGRGGQPDEPTGGRCARHDVAVQACRWTGAGSLPGCGTRPGRWTRSVSCHKCMVRTLGSIPRHASGSVIAGAPVRGPGRAWMLHRSGSRGRTVVR